MDKNSIKKYAIWARNELISRVKQKAIGYGIEDRADNDKNAVSHNEYLFSDAEKKQRAALIDKINENGYEQTMEEAAYTWFNRFCALRYMEVNGYLPSRVRVFTDENNNFKPQILEEAIDLDFDGLDMSKVYELKQADKTEELYKYLLITQCNALSSVLPEMFQKINDYTELLFPDNLLREGSVIDRMIYMIDEEDWTDQVQIIGWLYQYWNTEPKDKVFADLKKNVKITPQKIPAATQLFTPDWIVRYMVENSLGRLYYEGMLAAGLQDGADLRRLEEVKDEWKYYLDEAEQEPEVKEKLDELRTADLWGRDVRNIKFLDPCMGSGHILVYAFDVFMQMYRREGYNDRDAARLILRNNLYGLDIDKRAYQLTYFALMMKARQYNRSILDGETEPNISHFQDLDKIDASAADEPIYNLALQFRDASNIGSLITIDADDALDEAIDKFDGVVGLNMQQLEHLMRLYTILTQKYDVVCTNPPYMGSSGMNGDLASYVKKNYPNSKSDLFAAFIEHCIAITKENGYCSMVTMQSWMFLSSFEKMRQNIIEKKTISNLMHMENMVMGIAFGTAVTVFWNQSIKGYKGTYNQIKLQDIKDDIPKEFPVKANRFAQTSADNFSKIPGSPVAYWVSENLFNTFSSKFNLDSKLTFRQGMTTTNNERYLRRWYEVDLNNIGFEIKSRKESSESRKVWFPYQKGGEFRKWYGNNEYIVYYYNDGFELIELVRKKYPNISDPEFIIKNRNWYFKQGLTWSTLSSGSIGVRYVNGGYIFDAKGSMGFCSEMNNIADYIALLNSKITMKYLDILSPTMDFNIIGLKAIPAIFSEKKRECVENITKENISLSKSDWDSFETSWDFKTHPLVHYSDKRKMGDDVNGWLEMSFEDWKQETKERFDTLKKNEEELNRIFIDIYGLQDELTPEVEDKDVTVRKADLQRDIKSLISYAVGCMFGRYSLDTEGLAYAGGEWDDSKYKTFIPDADAIIPISDDEYFNDDIVSRFAEFISVVYGKATLEENLRFIANALGGKGNPREVIRNYFINDFFKDHCKIYQKRPIYWLFDSGKKNGFKALIYMHRYEPDTIARIRTDYIHEQQSRYRTQIEDLEKRVIGAPTSERVKLNKQLKKFKEQDAELHTYEEKIHHLADKMIRIDLDDGVKHNYALFGDVLAKIK